MQQTHFPGYTYSANEKDKKSKPERRIQKQKKLVSYIDIKYAGKNGTREEMDKDIVF